MKIKSLIFKLLGAFLLVITVSSVVMSLLISSETKSAFTLYTTQNSQTIAERLAPSLEEYYSSKGSWSGVDSYLSSVSLLSYSPNGSVSSNNGQQQNPGQTTILNQNQNPAPNQSQSQNPASGLAPLPGQVPDLGPKDTMSALDQRVVLADSTGNVIYDSQSEMVNSKLTADEIKNGKSITVNNKTVGTLVVSPRNPNVEGTQSGKFLSSANQAVINGAIIAAVIALVIGAMLFSQITAPLRKLKKAANSIARGDLNQRVDIHTEDEIGELGKSFNSMAESLVKAEIQRQHWMADIAHELRTPLAAIQATLEGMQDGILPMDREQVDSLYDESALLNHLIGDLRLLSLAEAGQIELECVPSNVGELIQKIVDRMKVQSDQKGIQLIAEIGSNLPLVDLDPYRMTEVFNNLITNSLRYTPPGGSITITAKPDSDPAFICLSVTDNGSGIDAENLPHVFDRFFRVDKSRTRSSGGSGLGLAIVKQLVESHQGTVMVESPVSFDARSQPCGTSFHIRLPIKNHSTLNEG